MGRKRGRVCPSTSLEHRAVSHRRLATATALPGGQLGSHLHHASLVTAVWSWWRELEAPIRPQIRPPKDTTTASATASPPPRTKLQCLGTWQAGAVTDFAAGQARLKARRKEKELRSSREAREVRLVGDGRVAGPWLELPLAASHWPIVARRAGTFPDRSRDVSAGPGQEPPDGDPCRAPPNHLSASSTATGKLNRDTQQCAFSPPASNNYTQDCNCPL